MEEFFEKEDKMKINCVDLELSIERIEVLLKMGIGKGMERMMEKRIKK